MSRSSTRGATAGFRAWTQLEDDALRVNFGRVSAIELATQLGRSVGAVFHRANRLGLKARRRWTKADDRELRWLWESGELGVTAIAKRLGRTPVTTYWRAQKLGLPLGVPEGFEYLTHAAERTGYARETLMRVLRWAGVTTHRAMARPTKGASHRMRFVDPYEVDEAIVRWHETETLESAARRLGACAETLRRRLSAQGINDEGRAPKTHWRVRSVDAERAVAA